MQQKTGAKVKCKNAPLFPFAHAPRTFSVSVSAAWTPYAHRARAVCPTATPLQQQHTTRRVTWPLHCLCAWTVQHRLRFLAVATAAVAVRRTVTTVNLQKTRTRRCSLRASVAALHAPRRARLLRLLLLLPLHAWMTCQRMAVSQALQALQAVPRVQIRAAVAARPLTAALALVPVLTASWAP